MDDLRTNSNAGATEERDPFLVALGERIRSLRARKGMTRRALANASSVSERHLANLELGIGNASVLVLREIAKALGCSLAEMLGDETAGSPEWLLIRELLRGRDDADLRRGRLALSELYGKAGQPAARKRRIALIGLRGAGKSTLGQMLADDLDVPFVELNREIEQLAGCSVAEVHNLYGPTAYRRYERRALEHVLESYPDAVIATPGGIVSDASTFNLLLSQCFTIWLQAAPEDHMGRVEEQGDMRPMAGNRHRQEAMEDLRRILAARQAFYGKADLSFDTSGKALANSFAQLHVAVHDALNSSAEDVRRALTARSRRAHAADCMITLDRQGACTIMRSAWAHRSPRGWMPMSAPNVSADLPLADAPVDYQTAPSRYRHWSLSFDGPIATLGMNVAEDGGIRRGYKLKLNSYDLGVDIELHDALNRIRFEHPEVHAVVITSLRERIFCSGANIFMLGLSSHAWKVNFCKFTNETRNGIEDASRHSGLKFLAAINGNCAGGGYEMALACDEIWLVDDRSSAVSLPEVPLLGVLPGTGGLTRLTDKRRVRRDLADIFCTTTEGVRGERAKQWRLVDEVVKTAEFGERIHRRARELAAQSDRPAQVRGVALPPLRRTVTTDRLEYEHVTVEIDRRRRQATITGARHATRNRSAGRDPTGATWGRSRWAASWTTRSCRSARTSWTSALGFCGRQATRKRCWPPTHR